MSREDDQAHLRLPAGLREELKAAAKFNGRSMSAEMVFRLQNNRALHEVVTSGLNDEMMGLADQLGLAHERVTEAMVEQQEHFVTEAEDITTRLIAIRQRLNALVARSKQ